MRNVLQPEKEGLVDAAPSAEICRNLCKLAEEIWVPLISNQNIAVSDSISYATDPAVLCSSRFTMPPTSVLTKASV